MRKNEALIGAIIFAIITLLALILSGCDGELRNRRTESFAECAKLCGAKPVEVRFDRGGFLAACRCDVVISTDVEVE